MRVFRPDPSLGGVEGGERTDAPPAHDERGDDRGTDSKLAEVDPRLDVHAVVRPRPEQGLNGLTRAKARAAGPLDGEQHVAVGDREQLRLRQGAKVWGSLLGRLETEAATQMRQRR